MALDTRHSVVTRNAKLDARGDLFNNGKLRIYTTGSGRPATPETAITDQVLLAELTFGADGIAAAAAGAAAANAITADSSADNAGVATWARAVKADGTTVIEDYSAGRNGYAADGVTVSGGAVYNINLNAAVIAAGANVSVSSMNLSEPMQGA